MSATYYNVSLSDRYGSYLTASGSALFVLRGVRVRRFASLGGDPVAMQIPVPLGNEEIHNPAEGVTQCIEFVVCPDCSMIAAAQWGDRLESTDGPVEHVRVACVNRHWFFMPADTFTERLQNC